MGIYEDFGVVQLCNCALMGKEGSLWLDGKFWEAKVFGSETSWSRLRNNNNSHPSSVSKNHNDNDKKMKIVSQ